MVPASHNNDGVLRMKDESMRKLSLAHDNIGHDIAEAKIASGAEKEMSVRDAVKLYRRGIICSLIMSLAVVMEG